MDITKARKVDRESFARFFWDASPRSLFMGPPLPEGLNLWWPQFMLAADPTGLITKLNLKVLNIKKGIANAIAGKELIPSEPYPKR